MDRQNSNANQLPDDALWVLQVSDTHLYADQGGTLAGVNTLHTMHQTLNMALHTLPRKPDLLIATGDLVHDASIAGYDRLARSLLALEIPVYVLPGNHDNPKLMTERMAANGIPVNRLLDTEHWRILMLDSTVAGKEGGHLDTDELAWLEQQVQTTDKHVLLCLHHQPIPVGSRWIDTMAVDNGHVLLSLLNEHPQIKGVAWGHVHQAFEQFEKGVYWLSAPSTCIQFTPGSDEFSLDPVPPGCLVLALNAEGEISRQILRLDRLPGETELTLTGY
jgi:Icc protein